MSNPFHEYPSMPNSTAKWKTSYEHDKLLKKVDWIVTEKIHGANFSFIIENDKVGVETDAGEIPNDTIPEGVLCAKRTAVIKQDENFFQWKKVQARYAANALKVFQLVKKRMPDVSRVHIFGEIFGGKYDHPDVEAVKGARPVQAGIYYIPDTDFCCFDIGYKLRNAEEEDLVNDTPENDHRENEEEEDPDASGRPRISFVDWDDLEVLCKEADLPYAEVLFRGPMNEALNFDYKFVSTVPTRYGLPPLEKNFAEGVVVRPATEVIVMHGQRCLVKKKIEIFSEVTKGAKTGRQKNPGFDPSNQKLHDMDYEVQARVTENRLDATISKIGPIHEGKNFKPILDYFVNDTLKDVAEDVAEMWDALDEEEKKIMKKKATDSCRKMMAWKKQQEP